MAMAVAVVVLVAGLAGPSSAALPTPVGQPVCWGNNADNRSQLPTLDAGTTYIQVSASVESSCGLGSDQVVRCWGANNYGEGSVTTGTYTWVSNGYDHSCAISATTNATVCWGQSGNGQLAVPTGVTFRNVSCGWWHSCGIQFNGTVRCWGATGDKNYGQAVVPTTLAFSQVAPSDFHTCGLLTTNGTILCWGNNTSGATTAPAGEFIAVGAGESFSCGLLKSGTAMCWGSNATGALAVPAGAVFANLWVGGRYACGRTVSGGGMVCWGGNATQLTPPSNYYNWNDVSAGQGHICGFGATQTPSPTPSPRPPSPSSSTTAALSRTPTPTPSPTPSSTPTAPASSTPTPTPSSTATATATASSSATISPAATSTATPTATTSPTPSSAASSTATATATPSVTPSASSTRSPTPSPSSPVVSLAPISANVTATFGTDAPVVAVAAPVAATSGAPASNVQVRSELSQLQSGSTDLSNIVWAVTNSSDSGGGTTNSSSSSSTINYSAVLADNTTSVTQSYAFHAQSFASQFSGLDFTVSAGAIKWSINLTSTALNASSSSSSSGLQFAFRVSTNATTTTAASSSVRVFRNTPRTSMTTYWVPSGVADVVVEVQVFDVALVDGDLTAINHSVVLASNASSSLAYELMLWFPPFGRSLEYDPSIGLGVLVGSNGRDGGGTSSDNTAVIIGVAVAVPVAVVVVLAVIVAALVYGFYRRRKASGFGSAVNFEDDRADDNL